MANRDSLLAAMQLPQETVHKITEHNAALVDLDTMTQAIHDVYCGITADHADPSDKDRAQAQALMDSIQRFGA
ncbi:MAG TPA: hypothetical protein VFY23_01680 [Candidatus Limnocylindrales bacterium]|nr:hypothetical protein [Candidatus Limnocylindrales bacterium]